MTNTYHTHVDAEGRLILPPEAARALGLEPGAPVALESGVDQLTIQRPVTALRRVYLELTNRCNLTCATCMRNVWDAPFGHMTADTFNQVLDDLAAHDPKPEIFIGGYGEPLSHPDCLDFIAQAKAQGHPVSLITNGILLTEEVSRRLIELELDMLWVSMDGASPECYADVRLGDQLPVIIENLERLRAARLWAFGASPWAGSPQLGVAFVAMKRNIHDLVEVVRLASRLGAVEISISNVLAHDKALQAEVLYSRSTNQIASRNANQWKPLIHLPRLDIDAHTTEALLSLLGSTNQLEFFGGQLNQNLDRCPFVERGSVSLRWDGKVSPCLPLLYAHDYYLGERERHSEPYFVGDLAASTLTEIWQDHTYRCLRERLQVFDYSPCTYCNSCELADDNQGDCYGNDLPACGGCLWAQGLIRCP